MFLAVFTCAALHVEGRGEAMLGLRVMSFVDAHKKFSIRPSLGYKNVGRKNNLNRKPRKTTTVYG